MTVTGLLERMRAAVRALVRRTGAAPQLSWRSKVFDACLALGLALVAIEAGGDADVPAPAEFEATGIPAPPRPPGVDGELFLRIEGQETASELLMALMVLPLLVRRRFPLAVLWVVLAAAPAVSDYQAALRLSFYVCVLAAYSAAVYSPYRVLSLASLPFAALLYSQLQESAVPAVPVESVPFLILIPIAVVADGLHRWKRRADEGRVQMADLQHRQIEALQRAAEVERARIARELHDVVTHNVSVMVIQAGAARKVMESTPDAAREALVAVEAGGRAAMAELRHVMGLLTMDSDGVDPASTSDLAPQPGLDRLESLVQRVRETGVPVELTVTGEERPLPSGVELTAYRVVQEALTNTVKHAVGGSAKVHVDYGPTDLRVEVTDSGGRQGAAAAGGNGQGLLGLRERLDVYGGTLQTGLRLSGGYRVCAQIPLDAG